MTAFSEYVKQNYELVKHLPAKERLGALGQKYRNTSETVSVKPKGRPSKKSLSGGHVTGAGVTGAGITAGNITAGNIGVTGGNGKYALDLDAFGGMY